MTAGYRDGISLSKTYSLQEGFDQGYSLGAVLGLRVGYILGVFAALRHHGGDREEKETEGGRERGERLWKEAKKSLSMKEVFAEKYFDGDGLWRFDLGEGQQQQQQHPRGGTLRVAPAGEKEDEEGESTFFDVADTHPLIREWMQKAKDEMAWCVGSQIGMIEAESKPARGDEVWKIC